MDLTGKVAFVTGVSLLAGPRVETSGAPAACHGAMVIRRRARPAPERCFRSYRYYAHRLEAHAGGRRTRAMRERVPWNEGGASFCPGAHRAAVAR